MSDDSYDPASLVVLIIENNPSDLELACRAIINMGIPNCLTIPTGEAALAWLEHNPCDIVVFEHNLAGMNGQRFMSLVKETHPGIRLIATSQNRDPRFAVSWVQNGAADYVAKDDYFSSQLGRSVQAVARLMAMERDALNQEVLSSHGALDAAYSEAAWLLRLFRNRYGYNIPLPADRVNETYEWSDVVEAYHEYLEVSLRMFPETLVRAEDAVVRMIVERGLSPRDIVLSYQLALMRLKAASRREAQNPRVHPGVYLARVLVRAVEEYQKAVSYSATQNLA